MIVKIYYHLKTFDKSKEHRLLPFTIKLGKALDKRDEIAKVNKNTNYLYY